MFKIKANPLRVSSIIFTGIIILFMLVRKFIPANYTVPIEESLSEPLFADAFTLQDLYSLINSNEKEAIIIDIREPSAFDAGHIAEAINMSLEQIFNKENRKLLKRNRSVVYCSSESQAHTLAFLLKQCGYNTSAVNGNYQIIKTNVIDRFVPSYGFYSDEKQQYDYAAFIKQRETPVVFKIDKKQEIKTQGGC